MCLAKYNDTFKNKYGLLFKKTINNYSGPCLAKK